MTARTNLAAVVQLLQDNAPRVTIYDRGVPDAGIPVDPDGRVHVYAALYPQATRATTSNFATDVDGHGWGFQVTCVGGDVTRALACVDAVTAALDGRPLPLPGGAPTTFLQQIGDSGPVREDRDANPSRWWLALTYAVYVPAHDPA